MIDTTDETYTNINPVLYLYLINVNDFFYYTSGNILCICRRRVIKTT